MSIATLRNAPLAVIDCWRRFDAAEAALRERYLGPGHGPADADAFEAQMAGIASERDSAIRGIRASADRENASDEAQLRARLNRDGGRPGDAEIAAAWSNRVKPRLDSGATVSEVLDAPGLSRADVASVRAYFPSYVAAKVGPEAARAASTRAELEDATRRVDASEIALLTGDVREATVDSRARAGAERAMVRANEYDRTRRQARVPMPLDAAKELELGFEIAADLGVPAHEPGRRDWSAIAAEIDPEMRARAVRATLDPETQSRLNDDARSPAVDHRQPPPS